VLPLSLSLNKRLVAVLASVAAALMISIFTWQEKKSFWQLHVMDVGQGLAIIVEANHQVMIYDTGASFPTGFSMADSVIIPYLKNRGYWQVDTAVISHDDNDHAGGLALINQHVPIKHLIFNQHVGAKRCLAGDRWQWQFLTLEVLAPVVEKSQENDDSCVIRISDKHHSVLLTGDISKKIEKQLVNRFQSENKLKSDYLIVPHHGSKSSSSGLFIDAVSPTAAIFSAGFLNRWQMPVDDIVSRYHERGVKTYRTSQSGMVTIEFTGSHSYIKEYRKQHWPFWFAN